MANERESLQLPPALRIAANAGRIAANSGRMLNEEDGLQLPPALRIAANSGRGRKQRERDERMTLKAEAQAMRLRLAKMNDEDNNSSSVNSLCQNTSLPCPVPEPVVVEGKVSKSSGKYSNEVLKKKIKKVEKMLTTSKLGTKELKTLQKKLTEYRDQLKKQEQLDDNCTINDFSLNPAEVGEEDLVEGQEQDTMNDKILEVTVAEKVESNRILDEEQARESEDQKAHSLEMLKKKLKKVEKLKHKSTPGSKDYKKFEKKRMEYVKQIREHDIIECITTKDKEQEESKHKRQLEQPEKETNVERGDALRDQARKLLWQRYEEKQRKEDILEEDTESVESSEPIHMFFGGDKKSKKQAYLEEARKLKQEALEKRIQEEEANMKVKEEQHKKSTNQKVSPMEVSAEKEVTSRHSGENEAFKYNYVRSNDESKKQGYLEEARKLKQEALEKKRREEKQNKNEELNEDKQVDKQESSLLEIPVEASQHEFVDNDYQRKKESYLEEARRLKKEAMETRIEDNSIDARLQEGGNFQQAGSDDEECARKIECATSGEDLTQSDSDDESSSDSILTRSREQYRENDEQQFDSTSTDAATSNLREPSGLVEDQKNDQQCESYKSSIPTSNRRKPSFLEDIRIRAKDQKGDEQGNDSISISESTLNPKRSNFLEEVKSDGNEKKEEQHQSDTSRSTALTNKNFLDDIRSKGKEKKEDDQLVGTSQSSMSTPRRNKSFLEEIKSKRNIDIADQHQGDTTQSSNHIPRRSNSFLEAIKSKGREKKEDLPQGDTSRSSKSIPRKNKGFLEAIKLMGKGKKGDQPQDDAPKPAPRKSKSFLEEIKSKRRSEPREKQEHNPKDSPVAKQIIEKPNFLEEIRSKAQEKEKVKQNVLTLSHELDACENYPTSHLDQHKQREIENLSSPKKEETSECPDIESKGASKSFTDRRSLPQPLSNNTKKILRELESNEMRQKKLEKALMQNGIRITDDISYEEAKDKIADITNSMKELVAAGMDSYDVEKKYFLLEEQLSKYTAALMLTDEYAEEHQRMEQDWEDSIKDDNIDAIRKLRSHMPVKIRHLTEDQLVTTPTPNGKVLPKVIARKFKRTNILQLIRVDPDDIEMMHPSLLENMRTTGLTLTERRALHEHFRDVVERWAEKRSDPSIEKKWQWYQALRSKFKETLNPGNHQYSKRSDPIDYSDDYGYTQEAEYESGSRRNQTKKVLPKVSNEKSTKATKSSEAEILQDYRDRLRLEASETEVDKKLLRELFHSDKRTKSLEKQLTYAGLSLPKEDISYDVAKTKVAELTGELSKVAANMGNTSDSKELAKIEYNFGKLSQELDKYTNALMLTKEWAQEQKDKERQWEIDVSAANYEALQKVRRHMPVNIRNMSESALASDLTPNGKVLPKAIARKFKRTNILMILRTDPSVIEVMHPSSLEAMRTTGLTLTERRAIHEHLKDIAPKWKAMASDKMCERKWMWHASLQSKLKDMLENNKSVGQCSQSDYDADYGFPDDAEYEQQTVAKSNLLSMEELEKRRLEDDYN